MIGTILNVVLKILGLIGTTLGIVSAIDAKPVAEETHPLEIQTAVLAMAQYLVDPVLGLPKVLSNQAALLAAIGIAETDILEAIADLTDGTSPVSLPPTPPPGYGTGTVAADVWLYPIGALGTPAQSWLGQAGALAEVIGSNGAIPDGRGSLFAVENFLEDFNNPPPADGPVFASPANILSTDTRLIWLNREWPLPGPGWLYDTGSDSYYFNDSAGTAQWRCLVTQEWFLRLQQIAVSGAVPGSLVPPIWPGAANVTLGASQALSDGLLIPGPLDGVLVTIATVGYPIGFYPFGPLKSYTKVGGIVFVDDNGEAELAQPLGLQTNVISPQKMVHADHAYLRLQSGVTGTIQPWTIT